MKLRQLRKALKMTQKQFAKEFEVSQAHVSWWEKGYVVPSIPTIVCLNTWFGWKLDEMEVEHFTKFDFGDKGIRIEKV